MYSSDELFQRSRVLFWCWKYIYNKHQINIQVSAETVRHESTYIISFLTRHNEILNDDKTTMFTHRPRVSLAQSLFCWWRHNRLLMTAQWPDNCDAITWIVICDSLDIDFIHCDIRANVQTEMRFGVAQLLFTTPNLWKQELCYSKSHFSLHVNAKQRGHIVWFHKHKIELRYV